MKKVYFKPPFSTDYLMNKFFRINSIHNTYFNADKRLRNYDVIFNTIDFDKDNQGDLYIYADVPYPWEIASWWKVIRNIGKNILFGSESPLVNPFNHLTFVLFFFIKVFTWDDFVIDNKKYFKFFVQQTTYGIYTKRVPFKKKRFLTFINNKKNIPWIFLFLSPYKINLYTKRFEILDFFSKEIPLEFDFYGNGWDKPIFWNIKERVFGIKKYPTYKGKHKEDKLITLSRYKFCLCFENAVAPGYITEKIFDCFKAGCVPIYWGAPNISLYIANGCFIDFRDFSDLNKLLIYLQNMEEKTYQNYLKRIEKFMNKENTKKIWFEDNFVKTINYLINKQVD